MLNCYFLVGIETGAAIGTTGTVVRGFFFMRFVNPVWALNM